MSSSTLMTIQTQINLYVYPIIMVLGSIGNIFIFILFNRQRQNACSIYLMHSAITNLLYLLTSGFFKIFSVPYYDQSIGALVLCKFISYTPAFLGQVAKTILVLACIDRYLITNDRVHFRAFSTPKRAKYLIFFSYIFWLIVASHLLIWTTVNNGRCTQVGTYGTIFTVYAILFVGLIPSVILSVFGYLTYRNRRLLHIRIQPIVQFRNIANNSLLRRDRELLLLVIAEVIVYIITTSLLPAVLLETLISQYVIPNKSSQYTLSEIFVLNLAFLLLFVYSATPFYTFIISSAPFRRDFIQLIMNTYRKVIGQTPVPNTVRIHQRIIQQNIRF